MGWFTRADSRHRFIGSPSLDEQLRHRFIGSPSLIFMGFIIFIVFIIVIIERTFIRSHGTIKQL